MIGNTSTIGSKGAYASGNFASKKAIEQKSFCSEDKGGGQSPPSGQRAPSHRGGSRVVNESPRRQQPLVGSSAVASHRHALKGRPLRRDQRKRRESTKPSRRPYGKGGLLSTLPNQRARGRPMQGELEWKEITHSNHCEWHPLNQRIFGSLWERLAHPILSTNSPAKRAAMDRQRSATLFEAWVGPSLWS